jgi:hypothetical protein
MNIKDTFGPRKVKEYQKGYDKGQNPFLEIPGDSSDAFILGFTTGRQEYEDRNGRLTDAIPLRIVTTKTLEDFQLAGMLGLQVDTENYNEHQLNILSEWYKVGTQQYDPASGQALLALLEMKGIQITP